MTISSPAVVLPVKARATVPLRRVRQALAGGLITLAISAGSALASPQVAPPRAVILAPSSNARFQQTVQQQQVRDNLQKAQVEAQNRQAVSANSRLPHANNPQMQDQIDKSDAAQQAIERSRQQDMINQYQAAPVPQGRVVVPQKPAGGG
ncbi:MAG: hypothetical protein WDW38_011189 [Sanguina aurantia]